MTPTPSAGGKPRVAVLVYNDSTNDSRVLKESETLRAFGFQVRIVAVERRLNGRAAGIDELAEGLDRVRVREFALDRVLPALSNRWRRRGLAVTAEPKRPKDQEAPTVGRHATPHGNSRMSRSVVTKAVRIVGENLYHGVALSTYWARAAVVGCRFEPDIVHANDANTLVPALAIRALSRKPVAIVYDSHELWRHRNVRPNRLLAPLVDRVTEAIGIRLVDGIITVSPSIARWLQETYRLSQLPTLVRNVPVADGLPDRATGVLRERAGLTQEHRVIAYGGRVTSARGIEETIASLPHLEDDVHFVLLGYGEAAALEQVREHARAHGVEHRVHLIGAVAPDEVARALADGDVAVVHVRPICLSYRYALPNKLFESIRAGLPIAAADLPDMKAVVEQLGVGEVFQGSSAEDLAEALRAILESPERYQAAARAAAPHLTWEQETDQMMEMYRSLLRGQGVQR